jgi:hypothetical protein
LLGCFSITGSICASICYSMLARILRTVNIRQCREIETGTGKDRFVPVTLDRNDGWFVYVFGQR